LFDSVQGKGKKILPRTTRTNTNLLFDKEKAHKGVALVCLED